MYLAIADAQLTRDLVPVAYHDFSLSESGTDIPVHDVTLDQVSSITSTTYLESI